MQKPLGGLARYIEPVSLTTTCADVYERFSGDPELLILPVVTDGTPVGVADRLHVMLRLADRFGRPLYERKPITELMDPNPLLLSADATFAEIGPWLNSPEVLDHVRGFVVTRQEKYLGVTTVMALLQQAVTRMDGHATQLEKARCEAEDANRAKTRFLANMSHELRTPLNAIIGFSQIMADELFGPLGAPRYANYVRDILDSGSHLLSVINDILDLSKLEAGQLRLEESEFDLRLPVDNVIRMVTPEAERRRVRVAVALEAGMPRLRADERKIRQVLLNLVTNAIKFTPEGGEVRLSSDSVINGFFRLTVADTGIGMAPEDVPQALTPFGQIDNGLDRQYEGTGLGLPLSQALIRLHGGELEIDTAPGQGTRVSVAIPSTRLVPLSSH